MAIAFVDAWIQDDCRAILKPIFGNYRNWIRYQDIVSHRLLMEMWDPWVLGWRL